jgi:PPK2 family polyphosphate:nucleotide phosphotransferase
MADGSKRLSSKRLARLARRHRVDRPKQFRLKDVDPADTNGFDPDELGGETLQGNVRRLAKLQEKLYAQDRWAVLVVVQAMDAAGKDSTIEHVLSGVNPAGCQVFNFKAPTSQELDHDWLWRHVLCLPERGRIGIFNRSWYEEVLVVRVREEVMARARIPEELVTKDVWKERFEDIRAFERHLARNGTLVLKFFLHVSKGEQRKRLLSRIDEPAKNWKFELGDLEQREHWDAYMDAYEELIRETSTKHARWHVVPADDKRFLRFAVASAIVDALEEIDPKFPEFDKSRRAELAEARRRLGGGKPAAR